MTSSWEGVGIPSDALRGRLSLLEVARPGEQSTVEFLGREIFGGLETRPLVGSGDGGDSFFNSKHHVGAALLKHSDESSPFFSGNRDWPLAVGRALRIVPQRARRPR